MCRMFLAALLAFLPLASWADALENAYFVCDIFEKTGISSDCQVSNITSTVDAMIETSEAEARNVCGVMSNNMVQKQRFFGGQWKLRIYSPERADTPLAVCPLR